MNEVTYPESIAISKIDGIFGGMPRRHHIGSLLFPTLLACVLAGCQSGKRDVSSRESPSSSGRVSHWDEAPAGFTSTGKIQHGKASWYSIATNGGTRTASGERFRNNARTAAHRYLPMGTHVRVTNLRNGRSAIVRINDRGPFIKGRIIDVSIGIARELGMVTAGVVPCTVEVLERSH